MDNVVLQYLPNIFDFDVVLDGVVNAIIDSARRVKVGFASSHCNCHGRFLYSCLSWEKLRSDSIRVGDAVLFRFYALFCCRTI